MVKKKVKKRSYAHSHKRNLHKKKIKSVNKIHKLNIKHVKKRRHILRRIRNIIISKRIPSGISTLDKKIEGGFKKNSTNLIVGGPGSGKSVIGLQFLLDGVSKGEPCLYISFEETKKDFYSNMSSLGWDLQKLENQEKFFYMEYTPEKVKTMLEEGGGIIESLVIRKKIKRIVIDSISSFELLFEEDTRRREAALALFNILRKWDCTTLLTYENDGSSSNPTFQVLDFESDSIIYLTSQKKGNHRNKFIEITKMRGTNHSRKTHSYEIKKGGIVVKG
jgi:circadian clock protein KaiC